MDKKTIEIKGRLDSAPVIVPIGNETMVFVVLSVDSYLPPKHPTVLKMYAVFQKHVDAVIDSFQTSMIFSREKDCVVVTAYTDERGWVKPEILSFRNFTRSL